MAIPVELIVKLLKGYKQPEDIVGVNEFLRILPNILSGEPLSRFFTCALAAQTQSVRRKHSNSLNGKEVITLNMRRGALMIERHPVASMTFSRSNVYRRVSTGSANFSYQETACKYNFLSECANPQQLCNFAKF